ncbi:FLX1 Mitochondrial FAD carrier protein FLX1 [Candida maltosa Xu316]
MSSFHLSSREIETISGLAAGFSTTIVTHPLDVIKIRLQVSPNSSKNIKVSNYLSQYYRGLAPNLVGNISAWGIYFALYAEFKNKIHTDNSTVNYFSSSVLAGISTSLLTNPIWVLKTRILGSSKNETNAYKSAADGIKKMLKTEGISSFWKGSIPSLFSVFQASLQITIYDHMKNHLSHGTKEYLYTSATSKIISMLVMYPTQVVRARLQYSHTPSTIVSVIRELYAKEGGIKAFYKGIGANILRVLPATCVTFVVYEKVKKFLS